MKVGILLFSLNNNYEVVMLNQSAERILKTNQIKNSSITIYLIMLNNTILIYHLMQKC